MATFQGADFQSESVFWLGVESPVKEMLLKLHKSSESQILETTELRQMFSDFVSERDASIRVVMDKVADSYSCINTKVDKRHISSLKGELFQSATQVCQLTTVVEKQSEVIMNLNASLKDLKFKVSKSMEQQAKELKILTDKISSLDSILKSNSKSDVSCVEEKNVKKMPREICNSRSDLKIEQERITNDYITHTSSELKAEMFALSVRTRNEMTEFRRNLRAEVSSRLTPVLNAISSIEVALCVQTQMSSTYDAGSTDKKSSKDGKFDRNSGSVKKEIILDSDHNDYEMDDKERRKNKQQISRRRSEEEDEINENEKESHEDKKNYKRGSKTGTSEVVWECEKSENDDDNNPKDGYVWTKEVKGEKTENGDRRKRSDEDAVKMYEEKYNENIKDDHTIQRKIWGKDRGMKNRVKDNGVEESNNENDGDDRMNTKDHYNDEVIRAVTLNLQRITLREKVSSKILADLKTELDKSLRKKTNEKDFLNFKSDIQTLQKESELGWRIALGEIGSKMKKEKDFCNREIKELRNLILDSVRQQ